MNATRASAVLAAAILLAGCSPEVMYVDWKVDRLCAKDGGVRVFETAEAPKEFLRKDGSLDLAELQRSRPEHSYYVEQTAVTLKTNAPEIIRLETRLWRSFDHKLMALTNNYLRPTQNIGVPLVSQEWHDCVQGTDLAAIAIAVFPKSAAR